MSFLAPDPPVIMQPPDPPDAPPAPPPVVGGIQPQQKPKPKSKNRTFLGMNTLPGNSGIGGTGKTSGGNTLLGGV